MLGLVCIAFIETCLNEKELVCVLWSLGVREELEVLVGVLASSCLLLVLVIHASRVTLRTCS